MYFFAEIYRIWFQEVLYPANPAYPGSNYFHFCILLLSISFRIQPEASFVNKSRSSESLLFLPSLSFANKHLNFWNSPIHPSCIYFPQLPSCLIFVQPFHTLLQKKKTNHHVFVKSTDFFSSSGTAARVQHQTLLENSPSYIQRSILLYFLKDSVGVGVRWHSCSSS